MVLREGDTLGGYRVLRVIGAGGMGTVYQTEHLITRRIEAMKVLSLDIAADPDAAERFEREIQAQARLLHPNIVALYSAVRDGNAIGLVMEYVDGEPLARILERGPLPVHQATAYARQILDALAHAHASGILHGDVSPSNILVTGSGVVKLTDFGLGPAAGGVPAGTPWHMAPEQVRGLTALDERTDIYAAGTVLYEMLAGRKLFDAETPFDILRAHLDTVPPPPGVPVLDRVVLKALAKEPSARFQTSAEFRAAIDGALSRTGFLSPVVWGAAASFLLVLAAFAGFARMASRRTVPPLPGVARKAAPPPPAAAAELPPLPEPPPVVHRDPQRRRQFAVTRPRFEPPPADPATRAPEVELAPAPEPISTNPQAANLPLSGLPQLPPPAAGEAKPPKTGNRFVRALGHLNPFRKTARKDQ